MSISETVKKIRTAIYAKDVRNAIADGISEANNVANEAKNVANEARNIAQASEGGEIIDIRTDAYGYTHSRAGDAVRSIVKGIKTGITSVPVGKPDEWENTSEAPTLSSCTKKIIIPTNQKIKYTVPPGVKMILVTSNGVELHVVDNTNSTVKIESDYEISSDAQYEKITIILMIAGGISRKNYVINNFSIEHKAKVITPCVYIGYEEPAGSAGEISEYVKPGDIYISQKSEKIYMLTSIAYRGNTALHENWREISNNE